MSGPLLGLRLPVAAVTVTAGIAVGASLVLAACGSSRRDAGIRRS